MKEEEEDDDDDDDDGSGSQTRNIQHYTIEEPIF